MSSLRITVSDAPDQRWAWTISGEEHRPHSMPEYFPAEAHGVVAAESAGEALVLITTALGPGDFQEKLNNTIPWDLITGDRPITITITPLAEDGSAVRT